MHKKTWLLMSVCFLVLTVVPALYADYSKGVLKTDMGDPAQIVLARKFLMETLKANMIALSKRLGEGRIQDMAVHGQSIAAFATLMPPLFKETYAAAYPKGDEIFFKGAPPAEFEMAAEKLQAAAMAVEKAGEESSPDKAKAAVASLGAACGGCHSAYRGKR